MILSDAKQLLWLLLLVGIIIYDRFVSQKTADLFGPELSSIMLRHFDFRKQLWKRWLVYAGIFFLIIALARPQWGKKDEMLSAPGMDIVFAIDVSKSMLVSDLKPNRLENAKGTLSLLADELAGNRLALVAFAGSSFIECPLTPDVGAVKLFLEAISPNLIPVPGTDIGSAIRTAVQAFGESNNSRAIILITDGEDLSGSARAAADEAKNRGIKIYPVGIGTALGEPVPEIDEKGNQVGIKRDAKGEIVISRLDEKLLAELAEKTGGQVVSVNNLLTTIARLPKQKIKHSISYEYKDRFQWFIFLALLCLMAEYALTSRKTETRIFGLKWLIFGLILLSGTTQIYALPLENDITRGNRLYQRQQYAQAAQKYTRAVEKKPSKIGLFNLGDAFYKQGHFTESAKVFSALTAEANASKLKQAACYNLGNAQFRQEDYKGAITSYEEALKINPQDEDARYNLALAKKMLKKPKQKQQQKKQQQKKNEPQKKEQKNESKKSEMKKEDALRILQGVSGGEKHKAKVQKGKGGKNAQDW